MTVTLKSRPDEKGQVLKYYQSATGKKRLVVRFPYAQIDADFDDFLIIEKGNNK